MTILRSAAGLQLVRRLLRDRHFDAVLLLPVADGRLDGVFREHGTVDLHWRKRQLAHDVRVLDRKRLFDRLALHPFRSERGAGDGRPAAEGLELGFFNDLRLRVDFHLQLHHVAALRRAHEARPDVRVAFREAADVPGVVVVIHYFFAVCHYPLLLARFSRLTKPALFTALSESETFGTEAERPAVSWRRASLIYSAPSPSIFRKARTCCSSRKERSPPLSSSAS